MDIGRRDLFRNELADMLSVSEYYDAELYDFVWQMIAEYFTHE